VKRVPRLSLTAWILIALVIGALLGVFFPGFATRLAPVSNIFLRLIKSIVAPLLFGTIVYGIGSVGELKTVGRIAVKSLVYFEVATTLALVIGLLVVNIVRPGMGMTLTTNPPAFTGPPGRGSYT
jgi:proton glutamate symport protein